MSEKQVKKALELAKMALLELAYMAGDRADSAPEFNEFFNGRGLGNRACKALDKALSE